MHSLANILELNERRCSLSLCKTKEKGLIQQDFRNSKSVYIHYFQEIHEAYSSINHIADKMRYILINTESDDSTTQYKSSTDVHVNIFREDVKRRGKNKNSLESVDFVLYK